MFELVSELFRRRKSEEERQEIMVSARERLVSDHKLREKIISLLTTYGITEHKEWVNLGEEGQVSYTVMLDDEDIMRHIIRDVRPPVIEYSATRLWDEGITEILRIPFDSELSLVWSGYTYGGNQGGGVFTVSEPRILDGKTYHFSRNEMFGYTKVSSDSVVIDRGKYVLDPKNSSIGKLD